MDNAKFFAVVHVSLLNDAEWSNWSDSEIGRQCAVDHKTVKRLRADHLGNSQDGGERTVERNGKSYTMNTATIGTAPVRAFDPHQAREILGARPESDQPYKAISPTLAYLASVLIA